VDRGIWSVPKLMVRAHTLHSVDPQLHIDHCSVVVCATHSPVCAPRCVPTDAAWGAFWIRWSNATKDPGWDCMMMMLDSTWWSKRSTWTAETRNLRLHFPNSRCKIMLAEIRPSTTRDLAAQVEERNSVNPPKPRFPKPIKTLRP
jgi:hypothetical protein